MYLVKFSPASFFEFRFGSGYDGLCPFFYSAIVAVCVKLKVVFLEYTLCLNLRCSRVCVDLLLKPGQLRKSHCVHLVPPSSASFFQLRSSPSELSQVGEFRNCFLVVAGLHGRNGIVIFLLLVLP